MAKFYFNRLLTSEDLWSVKSGMKLYSLKSFNFSLSVAQNWFMLTDMKHILKLSSGSVAYHVLDY
mgnify:CR=1 FL=1